MSVDTTSSGPARIVVGVDGSSPSHEALRWAARLAPTLGATIQVVAAWQHQPSDDLMVQTAGVDWQQVSRDAVAEGVRTVFGADPPAGLVTTVLQGPPARTLLDAARGATMVVVGSRGLGGFAGLLLGSVSGHVAEHATCPVLVVHEPPRDKQ